MSNHQMLEYLFIYEQTHIHASVPLSSICTDGSIKM